MGQIISKYAFLPPTPPMYTVRSPDERSSTRKKRSDVPAVYIETAHSVEIPVVFIEQRDAQYTVLYSHGNAEDLGILYQTLRMFSSRWSANVLLYDYTGYGQSRRKNNNPTKKQKRLKPSEKACFADITACFRYLTDEKGIPASKIILYGRSLGSGPTVYLAKRVSKSIRGVILQSPLLSCVRVVCPCSPCGLCGGDMFRNGTRMKKIHCRTLIIHGRNDEVVPFEHGEELHRRCPGAKEVPGWWIEETGHNDVELRNGAEYEGRVRHFIHHLSAPEDEISLMRNAMAASASASVLPGAKASRTVVRTTIRTDDVDVGTLDNSDTSSLELPLSDDENTRQEGHSGSRST